MDGDRRGETVCVGGRFVSVDMSAEMDATVDLPSDMVDMTADVPADLGDDMADADMGVDMCSSEVLCANIECGQVTSTCGDVDCGGCSNGEVCQQNTCMCPQPSCEMRCGVVTNACGGMQDCGDTCKFGSMCEANQCVIDVALKSRSVPTSGFGWSIAQHGEWLAIGSPFETVDNDLNAGIVDLYRWQNGQWKFNRQFKGDGKENAFFGHSLALFDNVLVVGAPGDNSQRGRAFVFQNSAISAWREIDKVAGQDKALFGASVAILKGNANPLQSKAVIAVGSPNDERGKVAVFECSLLGGCTKQAEVEAKEGQQFGLSLDGEPDKGLMVVGQPDFGLNGRKTGRAVVFNTDAKELAIYKPATNDGQQTHGYAVNILGEMVVAGAPNKTVGGVVGAGAVYIHNAAGMMGINRLDSPAPSAMGRFGESSDFGAIDGKPVFVVGAPGQKTVFFSAQIGAQGLGDMKPLPQSSGATNQFGKSVLIAGDQKQILVGDPGQGRVYIYQVQ